MEFLRQQHWGGLPFSSPGELPDSGTELRPPAAALQVASLPLSHQGRPCKWYHMIFAFLFLTYFTWYDGLQVHPCCWKWHYSILLFWQSNIPLYTCSTSSSQTEMILLPPDCHKGYWDSTGNQGLSCLAQNRWETLPWLPTWSVSVFASNDNVNQSFSLWQVPRGNVVSMEGWAKVEGQFPTGQGCWSWAGQSLSTAAASVMEPCPRRPAQNRCPLHPRPLPAFLFVKKSLVKE